MFKVFFFELSKRQLEVLGQLTAVMVGSLFSPWYAMLERTLAPYISLDKLLSPDIMVALSTYLQLIRNMKAAGTAELMYSFIPSLGLCIVTMVAFLVACNFVGLFATRLVLERVEAGQVTPAGQAS